MDKFKIAIITSTIREGRVGLKVAEWVLNEATKIGEHDYEIVDLKDYPMSFNVDGHDQYVSKFNKKLSNFDGYIFVTAEYNHSIPGVLKNALDWINLKTMANRPAGIVSYGAIGGARAAEHLRNILGQLNVADISRQVMFNLFTDFDEKKNFVPQDLHMKAFQDLISQVELWAKAFKSIRE